MADPLLISDARFVRASAALEATGLLGWARVSVNGEMDLGYIAVRRTRDRRIVLSFPEHRDCVGRAHPTMHPLDRAASDAITEQVIEALSRWEWIP